MWHVASKCHKLRTQIGFVTEEAANIPTHLAHALYLSLSLSPCLHFCWLFIYAYQSIVATQLAATHFGWVGVCVGVLGATQLVSRRQLPQILPIKRGLVDQKAPLPFMLDNRQLAAATAAAADNLICGTNKVTPAPQFTKKKHTHRPHPYVAAKTWGHVKSLPTT